MMKARTVGLACVISIGICLAGPRKKPKFSRPEDRGVQFTGSSTAEVVQKLSVSTDRVEQRKLARELGERVIAGKLKLDATQQTLIDGYVDRLFGMASDKDGNTRGEARDQMARLWHVATPACLRAITDLKDSKKQKLARRSLALMKNEEIIKKVIGIGKAVANPRERYMVHMTLTEMKRQRTTVVPNRTCIDATKSQKLTDELIAPALAELAKKGMTPPWE
jgi:hypothetical protein